MQEFLAAYRAEGRSFTDWAKQHGYTPHKVIRVLNGFDKGHYGQAHEIAVALGLKTQRASI